jgi:hypothetical protein
VRAPDTNVGDVTAGADDAAIAARRVRRAEVEGMVRRAKESADGAIEWAHWYFKPNLHVFGEHQELAWPKATLHLEAMQRLRDLGCDETSEPCREYVYGVLWQEYVSNVLFDSHADALDWLKGLSDEEMRPELREHVLALFSQKTARKRARGPGNLSAKYARRNRVICRAADFLIIRIGYKLKRSPGAHEGPSEGKPDTESAASIISKALAQLNIPMSERTVEDAVEKAREAANRK